MKNSLLFVAVISITIFSCKKEFNSNAKPQQKTNSVTKQKAEESFGKAFAKSLSNQGLREVIKSEALKKFDNDFDILYAAIKDEKLENGQTVQQLVESNYDKGVDKDVLFAVPTLTIFVPNLGFFSAEKWDSKNIIPQVAVAHATSDKLNDKIRTFTSLGTETNLSYLQKPNIPTIVVKENERVDAISINSEEINSKKISFRYRNVAFENAYEKKQLEVSKKLILYSAMESGRTRDTSSGGGRTYVPSRHYDTSSLSGVSDSTVDYAAYNELKPQRDYIYYNIDTSVHKDSGRLNKNYVECISAIQLENMNTFKFISDDWTDGDLELYFNIFLLPRDSSAVNMLTKVAIIPQEELADSAKTEAYTSRDRNGKIVTTTNIIPEQIKIYSGSPFPIKIDTWDNYKYGSTWKISVYEYDPGGQTTVTTSVSSTYTNNFKGDAGVNIGVVKIGAEYGYTDAKTNSQTISYQITDASEQLGDAIINYDDNIYTKKQYSNTGRAPLFKYYGEKDMVSTGGIKIFVEPEKI